MTDSTTPLFDSIPSSDSVEASATDHKNDGANPIIVLDATPDTLPLLPLRDVVVFPHMVLPLFVGRNKSVRALENATAQGTQIVLVAQKKSIEDEPLMGDFYPVACLATVLQIMKLPDGTLKVLVEGKSRVMITETIEIDEHYRVRVEPIADPELGQDSDSLLQIEGLRRTLFDQFEQYVKLGKRVSPEIMNMLTGIDELSRFADTIAAHLPIKPEQKQKILSEHDLVARMELLLDLIEGEKEILTIEKKIRGRVKKQMEKSHRDYYLSEQVKAIQKEMGDDEVADLDQIEKKIKAAKMPKEAHEKAMSELKKLKLMASMSSEATVVRNYLDALIALPWSKKTKTNPDLDQAEAILDLEHHGLTKVKERIVEYLAVQNRVNKMRAPILCLVGPPGVGKTSLGQSIAKATSRKYVRMALGGVRDEAEIRGHRRTYIGSMPGKILQSLAKAGTRNPLFLLDEVDKMGSDFRGDPYAALLEVLDPEQNHTFSDHYIDVDFDLSDVMFVATSNSYNIPPALLDRMEIIRLSGYTEDEKVSIAHKHLIPKQIQANGLNDAEITIDESAVRDVIRYYTREAGVRSLEREVARICRKVVRSKMVRSKVSSAQKNTAQKGVTLIEQMEQTRVSSANLETYLGVQKYDFGFAESENKVGQVVGLAWTEVGGDLLTIESLIMPGKGQILTTGTLGDVMKESIAAARSIVRSRAAKFGVKEEVFEKTDLHVHVPEGATPKDGPSAGIAMTTALVSAYSKIPVRADVAMTGEITLRGEVLPIGGLKEKLLAAHRGGIKTVLIPHKNIKDLIEIPDNIKNVLEIIPVRYIEEVLRYALASTPKPLPEGLVAELPVPQAAGITLDNPQWAGHSVKH